MTVSATRGGCDVFFVHSNGMLSKRQRVKLASGKDSISQHLGYQYIGLSLYRRPPPLFCEADCIPQTTLWLA